MDKDASNAEKRTQTLRRQTNEAFLAPDGSFSITKTIAIFTQIAVLFHLGRFFDTLLDKPESLFIILTFLVAPDVFKKFISMRYGNGVKK